VHRWAGRILLTLGVVCGVVVGGVPPSSAANSPTSFLPDGDSATGSRGDVLSDRFDGVDSRAHLTLVATPKATRAAWYRCPGTRKKPTDPQGPSIRRSSASASRSAKIPSRQLRPRRRWTTRPTNCSGTSPARSICSSSTSWLSSTSATSPSSLVPIRCARQTLEQGVTVDDSGIGGRTTSGDIVAICTADFFFGPGAIFDPCQVGGGLPGGGAQTYQGAGALFEPFEHGDAVPNGGFVLRVRTSTDAEGLVAPIDFGADRVVQPAVEDEFDFCSVIRGAANYLEWECVFTAAQVADDSTMAIWITKVDGGGGQCSLLFECILDSHFSVSTRSQAKPPSAYFAVTPGNNDVAAGSSCAAPDVADDSSPGTVVRVHGCLQDQFGNPFVPRSRESQEAAA
jgi:hypothetical protein